MTVGGFWLLTRQILLKANSGGLAVDTLRLQELAQSNLQAVSLSWCKNILLFGNIKKSFEPKTWLTLFSFYILFSSKLELSCFYQAHAYMSCQRRRKSAGVRTILACIHTCAVQFFHSESFSYIYITTGGGYATWAIEIVPKFRGVSPLLMHKGKLWGREMKPMFSFLDTATFDIAEN